MSSRNDSDWLPSFKVFLHFIGFNLDLDRNIFNSFYENFNR
jgi:hypothetical protein